MVIVAVVVEMEVAVVAVVVVVVIAFISSIDVPLTAHFAWREVIWMRGRRSNRRRWSRRNLDVACLFIV